MGASTEKLLQSGYRYALALTHDPDEAEDLVQETWIKLRRSGYAEPEQGLFLRSLRNLWIDEVRRRQRQGTTVELDETRVADEPSPEENESLPEHFAVSETDLEAALGRIRPEEREVIYWNAVEGLSAREIAERTDRSRGTVLSLLARGKERLRRILYETSRSRDTGEMDRA